MNRLLKCSYFDNWVAKHRYQAANLMGLSGSTLKRWRTASGQVAEDMRPESPVHPSSTN
jgi:hypothetical protein